MYSIGAYLDYLFSSHTRYWEVISSTSFLFLTLSTVLISAGGYIINDYFDVEIDQVNRPEKVVVGKIISKQQAINLYGFVNILGLLFMSFSVYKTHFYLGIVIAFFWIVILWIYSSKLKKSFLLGNIVVAFCIGLVPFLVGQYFQHYNNNAALLNTYPFDNISLYPTKIGVGFGFFAFFSNLLREIVKDMEDAKGDQQAKAQTIPIVLGMSKTKNLSLVLWLVMLVFFMLFFVFTYDYIVDFNAFWLLVLSFVFLLYSGFMLLSKTTKSNLQKVSLGLKLSMIFGLILPLFWLLKLM